MVIDSSAVVAALGGESDARQYQEAIINAAGSFMSAVTALECRFVLHARFGSDMVREFEVMVGTAGIEVVPFDADQVALAYEAFRRYGKGMGHPAQLNICDCAAYALARSLGLPLLYKGGDFARTDLPSVL